jgi:hypothetical protein
MSTIKMRRRGILPAGYIVESGPPSLSASHVWWADDLAVADGGNVTSWTDRVGTVELTPQSSIISGINIDSPPKMSFNSINGNKTVKFNFTPDVLYTNLSTPLKGDGISFSDNKGCVVILGFANSNVNWATDADRSDLLMGTERGRTILKHYQYDFNISGGGLFQLNTSAARATSSKFFRFLELPGGIPDNGADYINSNACVLSDPSFGVDQFSQPDAVVASGQVPALYNSVNGKPFIFEVSTTSNNIIDSDYKYTVRENNFLRFTRSPSSSGSNWDNLDELVVGGFWSDANSAYYPFFGNGSGGAHNWNGYGTPPIGGYFATPFYTNKDLQIAYIGIFPDALTEIERTALYDWFESTYAIPVAPTVAEEDLYPPNISNKLYRAWAEDIYLHTAYDEMISGGGTTILNRGMSASVLAQQNLINNKTGVYSADINGGNGMGEFGDVDFTNPSGSATFIVKVGDLDEDLEVFSLNGRTSDGMTTDPDRYVKGGISSSGKAFIEQSRGDFASFTGGTETTITEDGIDYKVHTFTSSGTLTMVAPGEVEYLVVAGGGAGGETGSTSHAGGGGGAGGLLLGYNLNITSTQTITVGDGGTTVTGQAGGDGGNSSIGSLVTAIGGGGGGGGATSPGNGRSGGSGGGSSNRRTSTGGGGAGTVGQGFAGGNSGSSGRGGGGGGADGAGGIATGSNGGAGGASWSISISGTPTRYAGGGGGGDDNNVALGGTSSGGNGATSSVAATAGVVNTGGGGGGAGYANLSAANGGSGIVIIRYKAGYDPLEPAVNRVEGNTTLAPNDTALIEYSSTGSSYAISVNNSTQTLTTVAGNNNGYWFDKLAGNKNLTFSYGSSSSKCSTAYACFTSSGISSQERLNLYNWMLDYYDENSLPFAPIYLLSITSTSYTGYGGDASFRERKTLIDSRGMLFESNNPTYPHDIDFYPLVNEEFNVGFKVRDFDSGPRESSTPDLGPVPEVTGNIIWGDGSPNTPFTLPSISDDGVVNESHTYTAAGTYNMQIQTTDGDGGSNTQFVTAHVSTVAPDPVCDPTVIVDTSRYPSKVSVNIQNCRDLRGPYKVTIDWDDNTPVEEIGWNVIQPFYPLIPKAPVITHYYGGFGTRTITVTTTRLSGDATPISTSEQIIVNLGNMPSGGPDIPSAQYIWFADDLALPGWEQGSATTGDRKLQLTTFINEYGVSNWYDRVDGTRLQSFADGEFLPSGITLYPPQWDDNSFSGESSIFASKAISASNTLFSMYTFLRDETIRPLTSSGSIFVLVDLPFSTFLSDGYIDYINFGWTVLDTTSKNYLLFQLARVGETGGSATLNDVTVSAFVQRDIAPTSSIKAAQGYAGGTARTNTKVLVEISSDGTNLTFRVNNNVISQISGPSPITNQWSSSINATGASIKNTLILSVQSSRDGTGIVGPQVSLFGVSETPLTSTERTNLVAWVENYYGIDL